MPRKARRLIGSLFIHNMVQGINQEYIFQEDEDKIKYVSLMKKYYQKSNIVIIAYCIMDNHVHMLIYTNDIDNISKFMKELNSQYAMYYNRKHNRVGYVFRNRFDSKPIFTQKHILNCIKYIHMNPVKANKVSKEQDYIFSSYNDYINKENFINSKVLNFLFGSENNYLEKFFSMKYEKLNIEKEKADLNEILNQFLKEQNTDIKSLRKSSLLIKKLIGYLIENDYRHTKKELAEVLKISRSDLYRKMKG